MGVLRLKVMVCGSKVPSTYVHTYCMGHVLWAFSEKVMVYGEGFEGGRLAPIGEFHPVVGHGLWGTTT